MKLLFLVVLLSPSLALDVHLEPFAKNVVTRFLDGILNQVFENLSSNMSIPFVDLKEIGNFSNLELGATGLNKTLDGVKSHGFMLNIKAKSLMAGGQYHIVYFDVPGLFPVFGKGDFSVILEVIDLKMTLHTVRDFQREKFNFTVPELTIEVQGSKVKIDNLMDDPYVADFLSELLTNLIPGLAPILAQELKRVLPPKLEYYGNDIFKCLPLIVQEKIVECIKNVLFPKGQVLEELAMNLIEMLNERKREESFN